MKSKENAWTCSVPTSGLRGLHDFLAGVLTRNILIRFHFVYYSSGPDLAPRQFSLPVWHCVSRANAFGEDHSAGKFCERIAEQFELLHLAKNI